MLIMEIVCRNMSAMKNVESINILYNYCVLWEILYQQYKTIFCPKTSTAVRVYMNNFPRKGLLYTLNNYPTMPVNIYHFAQKYGVQNNPKMYNIIYK